jgi:hypothetical protein
MTASGGGLGKLLRLFSQSSQICATQPPSKYGLGHWVRLWRNKNLYRFSLCSVVHYISYVYPELVVCIQRNPKQGYILIDSRREWYNRPTGPEVAVQVRPDNKVVVRNSGLNGGLFLVFQKKFLRRVLLRAEGIEASEQAYAILISCKHRILVQAPVLAPWSISQVSTFFFYENQ